MWLPGTYHNGFAPRDGVPRYPSLWRGCIRAFHAGLGPSGLTLRDWSGKQKHGTITAAAGFGFYPCNGQYTLRGSTDWTSSLVSTGSTLGITDVLSVFAWVVPTTATGFQQIAGERDNSNRNFQLRSNSGKLSILYNVGSITSATNIPTDRLSCVGFTFNNGTSELWENGLSVGTTTGAGIGAFSLTFEIGNNSIGHFWSGSITEVRVYNRLLSAVEIALLSRRPGMSYELAPRLRAGETSAVAFQASWAYRSNLLLSSGGQW